VDVCVCVCVQVPVIDSLNMYLHTHTHMHPHPHAHTHMHAHPQITFAVFSNMASVLLQTDNTRSAHFTATVTTDTACPPGFIELAYYSDTSYVEQHTGNHATNHECLLAYTSMEAFMFGLSIICIAMMVVFLVHIAILGFHHKRQTLQTSSGI
jgi:hypothetical protein